MNSVHVPLPISLGPVLILSTHPCIGLPSGVSQVSSQIYLMHFFSSTYKPYALAIVFCLFDYPIQIRLGLYQKWVPRIFLGDLRRPVLRVDNLAAFIYRLFSNLGAQPPGTLRSFPSLDTDCFIFTVYGWGWDQKRAVLELTVP